MAHPLASSQRISECFMYQPSYEVRTQVTMSLVTLKKLISDAWRTFENSPNRDDSEGLNYVDETNTTVG